MRLFFLLGLCLSIADTHATVWISFSGGGDIEPWPVGQVSRETLKQPRHDQIWLPPILGDGGDANAPWPNRQTGQSARSIR